MSVFVYNDSEDRLIATNLTPAGILGDYVTLEVVEIAPFGAFMEWGLEKHLLVPNAEMAQEMEVGHKYVVRIMLDYKTERLIACVVHECWKFKCIRLRTKIQFCQCVAAPPFPLSRAHMLPPDCYWRLISIMR